MKVAKIIELIGCSEKSFEDALKNAIEAAEQTIHNITGAEIISQNVKIRNNKIVEYRVNVKLAFGVEREQDP